MNANELSACVMWAKNYRIDVVRISKEPPVLNFIFIYDLKISFLQDGRFWVDATSFTSFDNAIIYLWKHYAKKAWLTSTEQETTA